MIFYHYADTIGSANYQKSSSKNSKVGQKDQKQWKIPFYWGKIARHSRYNDMKDNKTEVKDYILEARLKLKSYYDKGKIEKQ